MNAASRNPVSLETLRAAIRESEQNFYYAETTENGLTGAALFDAQTNTMRIRTQLRGRRAALASRLAAL